MTLEALWRDVGFTPNPKQEVAIYNGPQFSDRNLRWYSAS